MLKEGGALEMFVNIGQWSIQVSNVSISTWQHREGILIVNNGFDGSQLLISLNVKSYFDSISLSCVDLHFLLFENITRN